MNVTLPEKLKLKKRQIAFYITIIIICIISILSAFYIEFYARIDLGEFIGIKSEVRYGNKKEEEIESIKAEFGQIFNNQIINHDEDDKKIVSTIYEKKISKLNSYDLNVHIPYIDIQNEIVKQYNKEIEDIFIKIAENILKTENRNIIYTVDYVANVQEGILSLMIKSNLKEGNKPQKVIIQTYNYDLRNNKEINLSEVLRIGKLEEDNVQNLIKEEIKKAQKKVEDLKKIGYNIYNRDVKRDIYTIEKSTEFYLTNNTLYIIYAYGNETETSEMDLIIL